MNILLIEDEPLVAKNLEKLIFQIEPEASILAIIGTVKESVDWLKKYPNPDLILSDIQLADGVSFDIFHEIEPKCPIIFTTAYDEYAIRAFKLNSIDYLLKPIDKEELGRAFEKFKNWSFRSNTNYLEQFKTLLHEVENKTERISYKNRFTAHFQRNIVAVHSEKIVCFFRDEVIWLQTSDNQKMITDYHSLDEIEELLNPAVYFRANRQYIVNKNGIESYRTHFSGKIELKLCVKAKEEVVVSKEKAHQFRHWFAED